MQKLFSLLCLGLALLASPARALCNGQDLIAALPAADRADLRARADAVPFAVGNLWRATRGDAQITLVGTLHLDDPRFEALMVELAPLVQAARLLLVEAGPREERLLKARLSQDPSLLINTDGPTLPELMPKPDWQRLSAAMSARGVPGFMAAKFRPWYVSMLLSLPPCAMTGGVPNGLDQRLIALATETGMPIEALEPYDTAFKVFQDGSPEEQVKMLTGALAAEGQSEDMSATMINAYFAEEARLSWEFTKVWTRSLPGYDPATAAAEIGMVENNLMMGRNIAWIPVITAAVAAQEGPVFVAFGALHLAGDQGVLALLQAEGFKIERIPLNQTPTP